MNEEHFTFHLQYKRSGMFANRKYKELSYPKKTENVRPHSSNSVENETPLLACEQALLFGRVSSRENATPSSGTSPLASYKEVPPPPGAEICHFDL